jgi:RimJ/RimL family protein N-acetyltransferase
MRHTLDAPVLAGRLVRLEPLASVHVEDLAEAAAESRETFAYTTVPDGPEELAGYVQERLSSHDVMPFAQVRTDDGRVLGCTSFLSFRWWPGPIGHLYAVEIGGTWLAPSAQRSGMNREAKSLLLAHAFEAWRVARVDFKTDARNERARKAIDSLGARFEGVLRSWEPSRARGEEGALRDSAIYSVVASQWPSVSAHLQGALRGPLSAQPPRRS